MDGAWVRVGFKPAPTTDERTKRCNNAYARMTKGFVLVALALALAAACGGSSGDKDNQSGQQVRGLVVEVMERNITEVQLLRVRDEAGKFWIFTGGPGFIGITSSHLREHQLLGQSVLVTYEDRGDFLVAVDVRD